MSDQDQAKLVYLIKGAFCGSVQQFADKGRENQGGKAGKDEKCQPGDKDLFLWPDEAE